MEMYGASFTIKAAYDALPYPRNLSQGYGEDPTESPKVYVYVIMAPGTGLNVVCGPEAAPQFGL